MFGKKKTTSTLPKESPVDLSKYQFHVMPEQFLVSEKDRKKLKSETSPTSISGNIASVGARVAGGQDKTKIAGILIIVGGAIAVVAVAVLVYRLSFKSQTTPMTPPTESQSAGLEETPEETTPFETPEAENTEITPPIEEESETGISENIEEETPVMENETEPEMLQTAPDEDADTLTEQEELLFGTKKYVGDTDADGYLDGQEILNFYSPIGPGTLSESPLVQKTLALEKYELIFPYSWSMNFENDVVIIRAGTGEFFQISEMDNENSLPLKDWFGQQNQNMNGSVLTTKSYSQFNAIFSPDGLTAYLSHPELSKKILVIFYNPVDQEVLQYMTVFEMMLRSLSYVGND